MGLIHKRPHDDETDDDPGGRRSVHPDAPAGRRANLLEIGTVGNTTVGRTPDDKTNTIVLVGRWCGS
jgi:hypothetical protein